MEILRKSFPYIGAVLFCLFFFGTQCKVDREVQDLRAQLQFREMHLKDSFRNLQNQLVTESRVAVTSKEATIKQLSAEIFQLKKGEEKKIREVTTLVRLHQNVTVSNLDIPYIEPYVLTDTLLPSFKDSTKDYHIAGRVRPTGIHLQTVAFYDTVTFRVAEKKTGLFKRETVVQTVHSNPYYHSLGTQAITLKKRPTAWNRWIKPALFFGAGVFITTKL